MNERRILVVGGGPAGMMAALTAAQQEGEVTLLDRNRKLGRKLRITGKGRCNVTNDCTPAEVLQNVPRNSRFLYSALSQLSPPDVKTFFEELGVPLKTERGNRVFPQSDRADDVADALVRAMEKAGVRIRTGRAVAVLTENGAVAGVKLENGRRLTADRVILCTGGLSYPDTGSTGDGYTIAKALGHTVEPAKASLVPLTAEDCCRSLQGLSLRNIAIQVKNQDGKVLYRDFGELLFTHFGLSGPVILSASAHMRDFEHTKYTVGIDLKPALDDKTLDARLLRDFQQNANRDFQNSLNALLPQKLIPEVVRRSGIPPETKVHDLTREQRHALLRVLKQFSVAVIGPRPVQDAIVTSGGVRVSEVDPSTMASKLVPGLYLCGELLDVDGYTGGFNLQIAWSTGYAAGCWSVWDE
ncbi:MAG: NAD(P)/FAD-dependent oxidoreductase [Clostridiales bacterium]|nr:NAD(P)/FAD-dependent oxidoreductase [Clostridiales bacterium]